MACGDQALPAAAILDPTLTLTNLDLLRLVLVLMLLLTRLSLQSHVGELLFPASTRGKHFVLSRST